MNVLEHLRLSPREQFGHLVTEVHRLYRQSYQPSLIYAPYLPDVLESTVYEDKILHEKNISLWLDFDGVFDQPGRKYSHSEHLKTLYTLSTHASTVDILSARIPLVWHRPHEPYTGAFYHMPFISDELSFRIEKIFQHKHADLNVTIYHQPTKLFKRSSYDKFAQYVDHALRDGRMVVLVGSGVFDRVRFSQLLEDLRKRGINDVSRIILIDTGYYLR